MGIQDYDRYIKIEYILVYNDENNRNAHIKSISNNLENYVNKTKKTSHIIMENNAQLIGTIINNNPNGESINNDENNLLIIILLIIILLKIILFIIILVKIIFIIIIFLII